MLYITIKQNFIHIGIASLVAILIVYKRYGFAFIVAAVATVGLTDASSHYILKEGIGRLNCSNSFSFPSIHAGNTFAAATLISLCFRNTTLLAFTCALLVCYSRVYLKVHYPFDVLAGALYGSVMGYLGHRYIYLPISKFIQPEVCTKY